MGGARLQTARNDHHRGDPHTCQPHEKPPGNIQASGGMLLSRAGCRGTYPPPAAGYMNEHENRRQGDAPPPAALDGIILPHLFGSKVQFSNQSKIFCYLPDKIPVPLLCRPLRYAEL